MFSHVVLKPVPTHKNKEAAAAQPRKAEAAQPATAAAHNSRDRMNAAGSEKPFAMHMQRQLVCPIKHLLDNLVQITDMRLAQQRSHLQRYIPHLPCTLQQFKHLTCHARAHGCSQEAARHANEVHLSLGEIGDKEEPAARTTHCELLIIKGATGETPLPQR